MELTTLSTIKARIKIEKADITDDAILTNALDALSARIANECNRQFDFQDAATFVFRADEMNVGVDRYPIAAVAGFAVKSNETDGWVAVTGSDIPQYMIGPRLNIIEIGSPLGSSRQLAQVTFSGGYVLPCMKTSNGTVHLPSDLEQAVCEQIQYWYQRRNQLGLVSISGDGGSVSQFRSLDLLPNVQAIIKKYERWVM